MVYNMAPGYENAKYKYVWISTSRIKGELYTFTSYCMSTCGAQGVLIGH